MPKRVLITGTSSGLGRRTAEVLAERGHTIVATMCDPEGKDRTAADTLAASSGGRILVVPMDVRSDESVEAGVAAAVNHAGGLDVVVINAAYAITGVGESVTSHQLLAVLDTNVVGPQRVTRAALPHLRGQRSGLLVYLSSGAGRLTVPGMGAYSATKFAIEALAQAYRYELRGLGIDVSIIQPGAFPTNLAVSQVHGDDRSRLGDYDDVLGLTGTFMQQVGAIFADPRPPDVQEVADAVATLVDTGTGQRPDRISVDRFMLGEAVTAINAGAKEPTNRLLGKLGLAPVLG